MRQCFQEGPKRRECPTLCDPTDCSHQAPLSMGFSRPEYWSGLLFPSPGDLPSPGIEPRSPALQADSLPSEPPGKRKQSGGKVNCTQFHPLSTRVFLNVRLNLLFLRKRLQSTLFSITSLSVLLSSKSEISQKQQPVNFATEISE